MPIISNGIKRIDTESEEVLQSTEYFFPDSDYYFYRDVEGFGAVRYSIWSNQVICEGYVPWIGF